VCVCVLLPTSVACLVGVSRASRTEQTRAEQNTTQHNTTDNFVSLPLRRLPFSSRAETCVPLHTVPLGCTHQSSSSTVLPQPPNQGPRRGLPLLIYPPKIILLPEGLLHRIVWLVPITILHAPPTTNSGPPSVAWQEGRRSIRGCWMMQLSSGVGKKGKKGVMEV
jgi:hypothetical protein